MTALSFQFLRPNPGSLSQLCSLSDIPNPVTQNLIYSIFKYILNLWTHHVYFCHSPLSYLISHVGCWNSLLTGKCLQPCLPVFCPQHSSQREPKPSHCFLCHLDSNSRPLPLLQCQLLSKAFPEYPNSNNNFCSQCTSCLFSIAFTTICYIHTHIIFYLFIFCLTSPTPSTST